MTGHQQRLGAGVVIGSNVFNLAAPPGLAAVAAGRIRLHPKVVVLGGAAAIRVAAVCLAVIPGLVPPVAGLVMAFGAIALDAVALGEAAGSRPASGCPRRGERGGTASAPALAAPWARRCTRGCRLTVRPVAEDNMTVPAADAMCLRTRLGAEASGSTEGSHRHHSAPGRTNAARNPLLPRTGCSACGHPGGRPRCQPLRVGDRRSSRLPLGLCLPAIQVWVFGGRLCRALIPAC